MKRVGLFLLAVVLVAIAGCGGGGSDSDEFDPTGSEWEFLVTTADAGDTMYTLTFFDSTGAKAASGLFTAVNWASGASYSGTWTSKDYVVTGVSSGIFAFTLNVNTDTTTGTIDYVTPEGTGSSAATRTDDERSYNFSGRWMVSTQVTTNTCGGPAYEGEMRITQSGGGITVEFPADATRVGSGTCDPSSGTIQFDVTYGGGSSSYNRWIGRGVDETTMTGTRKLYPDPGVTCQFEATWTATLVGR